MLDFAIRTGPWGDAYGQKPDGLTLEKLAAQPNGIDMGPLEPRLPGLLKTPSRKIELAPPYITGDVARLRARLARRDEGLVLVSRRHLRSNNSWMHNAPSLVTGKDRCTLLVHPDDARAAGLVHGKSRADHLARGQHRRARGGERRDAAGRGVPAARLGPRQARHTDRRGVEARRRVQQRDRAG